MEQVDSKFTLVNLAGQRARELGDYYNQLGAGVSRIAPPQVDPGPRKLLTVALEEIAAGKISYERLPLREGEVGYVAPDPADDVEVEDVVVVEVEEPLAKKAPAAKAAAKKAPVKKAAAKKAPAKKTAS